MSRNEDFDLNGIVDIVQRDPALSVSIMRLINSVFFGLRHKVKAIPHAIILLGQAEVRKWITVSATRMLGIDKPNEITKLSLVRAKFAENLAGFFNLKSESDSLFMMGMFSVLDIVLGMDMEEVYSNLQMSDDIYDALVNHTGRYEPVLSLIKNYEMADWAAVVRVIIFCDMTIQDIYNAYIDAMIWYRDLFDS